MDIDDATLGNTPPSHLLNCVNHAQHVCQSLTPGSDEFCWPDQPPSQKTTVRPYCLEDCQAHQFTHRTACGLIHSGDDYHYLCFDAGARASHIEFIRHVAHDRKFRPAAEMWRMI